MSGGAEKFLHTYATPYTLLDAHPPTKNQFKVNLRRKKDTAPGPDGIPYSAYFSCEDIAAEAFHNAAEGLFAGIPPPLASTIRRLPFCRKVNSQKTNLKLFATENARGRLG